MNVCSFVLLCALAITGGAVWALLSERNELQRQMTELRRHQSTQEENHKRDATTWRQEVQKALQTPVRTSYNASAFFCCFDGPAWMQKRYTVMLGNALNALPPSVKVQVFHRGDSSWERGLHLNPGVDTPEADPWIEAGLPRAAAKNPQGETERCFAVLRSVEYAGRRDRIGVWEWGRVLRERFGPFSRTSRPSSSSTATGCC